MKKLVLIGLLGMTTLIQAQVQTPKASPLARIDQRVGLTDISVSYSRPAIRNRIIFGDVVPLNEKWRLGANENTKFRTSDDLVFVGDTLKAGTYALYALPQVDHWALFFYKDTTNWGMPEKWEDEKVALIIKSGIEKPRMRAEELTIGIENMSNNGADLTIAWDEVCVRFPFSMNTKAKVMASIQKTMKSSTITANDYHAAANYYYTETIDLKQALKWSEKAVEMKGDTAYWMSFLLAQLQAANGDYKQAMSTAKSALLMAKNENDESYAKKIQESLDIWSKK